MTDIHTLAEQLGKAIAASPQAARLRQARQALTADAQTAQLLREYNAQASRLERLEAEQQPVGDEERRKLQELHGKLVSSELFKEYTQAQVEFAELMRTVNEAIRKPLGEVAGE